MEEELPNPLWTPIRIIIAVILLVLIIATVIPYYSVRLDPEPRNIPVLTALAFNISLEGNHSQDITHISQFVMPSDPQIKFAANKIVTLSCSPNPLCYAKALYYFVRDNIQYVADPLEQEYIEPPAEVLASGAADCESGSILLASLEEAIGIDAQLVLIQNHAYIRIKLDAPKKYQNNNYIYLDWTCKDCAFGEIPWKSWLARATIVEVP
ncbi:MAG: transglutaminase-like domain-containing protein [Candidatus Woesearchaeota archaeon]